MVTHILAISLVFVMTGASLGVANALRDLGASPPMTRWVASVIGGLTYLVAVLWLDAWVAIALSALSLLLIWALRSWRACLLRGVRGGPEGEDPRSEMEFPAAATVALAVGWGALHDPWMAFLAIAFMAWGDASAGLVRAWMNGSRYQAITASAAMLSVSLGSVWIFHPSVAGAAAAVTATFAEAFWPLTRSRLNDSWPVVGSAIGLMALDRVGWVAFLH